MIFKRKILVNSLFTQGAGEAYHLGKMFRGKPLAAVFGAVEAAPGFGDYQRIVVFLYVPVYQGLGKAGFAP
jgi:hypothetical protein